MKRLGFLIVACGVIVALASLLMKTSVPTESSAGGLFGTTGVTEVYNLGKLQAQLLIFVAGCSVTIIGIAVSMAGMIIDALSRGVEATSKPPITAEGWPDAVSSKPPTAPELTPEEELERLAREKRLDRGTYLFLGGIVLAGIVLAAATGGFSS